MLLRCQNFDHEVDDVARRAELARIPLTAQHAEQVFEGVTQALGVVVGETVDFLQEALERLRVAVRQVGILEDVAKQFGHAGVLAHALNGFAVERQHLEAAQTGRHELRPAKTGKGAGKKLSGYPQLFRLCVHVIHELVDERDGDLFNLRFRIGHFADEDVSAVVDAAFGVGVKHWDVMEMRLPWLRLKPGVAT